MADDLLERRNRCAITLEEKTASEEFFFAHQFPNSSGMRFNFDDIREFLHDPLIALIATDLTADENLDNVEKVLKRLRQGRRKTSSMEAAFAPGGIHKLFKARGSLEQQKTQEDSLSGTQEDILQEEILLEHETVCSIPALCRDLLWRQPQEFEPLLMLPKPYNAIKLLRRMILECLCSELLYFVTL